MYAIDFKNAGLSEGDCPGNYTVEELEDQAVKFIQFIQDDLKANTKQPKIFLIGISMGGLVTLKLSVKYKDKFAGAIMLAPALRDCS